MIKQKVKASIVHLLISLVVVGCFIAFALLVWYPAPFMSIAGLTGIVAILISVDLVLGPLLTFVVFKPKKPRLALDLSVIAAVQMAALGYGMYTIYQGHPVYVAYAVDRFTVITAQDANPEQAKYPDLQVSTLWAPKLVYAKVPTDPELVQALLLDALAGKPDVDARSEYYEPFDAFVPEVLKKGIKPEVLFASPDNKQKLEAFLKKQGNTAADYAFLPLSGKEDDVVWVWSRDTGKPVGTLAINPWNTLQVSAKNGG
ncbi:TfpX/TfpZ family type IV pilin accessory protein [Thiothrix lacustris]|uniref:TfpX/TfpZ family type IV pilin accessory protein n=1 Tax=Thiothrix lacustris TaxID=525917 RepID=UPI0027E43D37|nr:TfpX/TfpZ family type IV pilin accessory protein [Thiothrix lacustris]WMP18887.1 TfpX/TfpZ family type IV pilin accessory protein [Thiothrix lacustris]